MTIPCYITNRDLLDSPRGIVEHLKQCDGVGEITIVDCASTYPPLLEWYDRCGVTVRRCENLGPRAPWHLRPHCSEYYFVTDGDLDFTGVPHDFLTLLQAGLDEHPDRIKAGLSLRLDDIPADLPLTAGVLEMESAYWAKRLTDQWYDAPIDTTAALYRDHNEWGGYGPALRAAPPYVAKHTAWYLRPGQIPEDWRYYLDHLSPAGILWSPRLANSLS